MPQGGVHRRDTYNSSIRRINTDREVKRFIVLPKRWIVERTFGWVNRARRLAKDFETLITSSHAWFMLSMCFPAHPRGRPRLRGGRVISSQALWM
ncbi:transposase [Rhodopila sp.]|uniref:transposase n=1 Tax=Rhodopila sp. TaxID=2480087 RepID=UPI003D113F39